MKKQGYFSDIKRVKNVIENDRLCFSTQSLPIITADITYIINNYFTLTEKPNIEIVKNNGEYKILISCNASAIKSFAVIP